MTYNGLSKMEPDMTLGNAVMYKKGHPLCESLGRNGRIITTGIDIDCIMGSRVEVIWLSPITSRKRLGKCWIALPKSEIPALIEGLKKELATHL